jgi:hypothetical protein
VVKLGACALLVACNIDAPIVAPAIDSPLNASAQPFPNLDTLQLAVAQAGASTDEVSQTFAQGATIALAGVPFEPALVVHMAGFVGSSEVAYGRTCAFGLAEGVAPPQPHLYFSRIAKFGTLAQTALARRGGHGWTLVGLR